MTTQRRITTGVERTADLLDTYRVFAECDDEVTSLIVSNMRALGLDLAASRSQAELQRMALAEHLERCTRCRETTTRSRGDDR